MIEIMESEKLTIPAYKEKPLTGNEPARCVDGRPSESSPQGPQMLGGSLHPILLEAIYHGQDITTDNVLKSMHSLVASGIQTGVHKGEHAKEDSSDCGFADRMPEIIETAQKQKSEISERLIGTFNENQDKFINFNLPPFEDMLQEAYKLIENYNPEKIKTKGEKLVNSLVNSGSALEVVEGEHKEKVAFVNINPNTTLDTKSLNANDTQGFNLDLLTAVTQAAKIGIPQNFAIPASLILYQATEIVLVENKGKNQLPVKVHN